jgi:hypothetical protein
MKTIILYDKTEVLVDDEDYERLSKYKWVRAGAYAVRCLGNNKYIQMHREIMNAPAHLQVDHINQNKNDHRKCNLRLVTHSQNHCNIGKTAKNSISLFKGVSWHKQNHRWYARLGSRINPRSLGGFDHEIKAALAFDKAAREVYGEYACPNFTDEEFEALSRILL